jgi:hypothetical protein
MVRMSILSLCLAVLLSAEAYGRERPSFDKYHVVPHGSHFGPGVLTTGQFGLVLGSRLTPERWCDAPHTQQPPYPLTVCGVQVLIDAQPAGLMYVGTYGNNTGSDQINFQVPKGIGTEGDVPFRVCVGNLCSDPLQVPFTNKEILLKAEGKAYVNMPLWVGFTIPFNNDFGYPASTCPWDLGGFRIEVRKDGHVLPSNPMPKCTDVDQLETLSAISLPKGVSHRLPVHLYHIFHSPGEYELRMTGPLLTPDLSKVSRTGYSDWIHVTVEPFSDTERQAWLDTVTRPIPSGNAQGHESELIVSLLAQPDKKALKALLNFLPSPPSPDAAPVRRVLNGNLPMNWPRDCLARAALAAFPDALLKDLIPPARLVNLRETPAYCHWR